MLQLFVVALVWGTVGTTSRLLFAMEHPPNAFLLVALANITGFVFLGVRQMGPKGFSGLTIDHHGLMGGLETGFWYHTSILMLYAGLERTSATHEAFIAQLCTLMVPALQAFQGEKVSGSIWGACVLAMVGCMTLAGEGASGGGASVEGDVLCLASAFLFALHNVRLSSYASLGANVESLALCNKATQAALGLATLAGATYLGFCPPPSDFAAASSLQELGSFGLFLLWNGSVVKGLASLWHAEAYKNVSPSKAEVVLATTPLWALGLAVLFLAEPVGGQTVVGATLFMAALFLAASPPSEEGPDANGVLAPPSDSSSDDVGTATLVEA